MIERSISAVCRHNSVRRQIQAVNAGAGVHLRDGKFGDEVTDLLTANLSIWPMIPARLTTLPPKILRRSRT